MTKESKKTLILTSAICLIPIAAGIILYPELPERIVTHWDINGNPDGWSSRFFGVIGLPALLLAVNLLCPFLVNMDPKNKNMSEKAKGLIQWIIPMIALFAGGTTLMAAAGIEVNINRIAPVFMGVMFTIIGNYLPKMSQSYTVGIKLPWTLDDEENWDRTHRFAGLLWVICGLLLIACSFIKRGSAIFFIILAVMVFLPAIYSYVFYLKKKKHSEQ